MLRSTEDLGEALGSADPRDVLLRHARRHLRLPRRQVGKSESELRLESQERNRTPKMEVNSFVGFRE